MYILLSCRVDVGFFLFQTSFNELVKLKNVFSSIVQLITSACMEQPNVNLMDSF